MIWLTWRHLRAQTTALYAGVLGLAVVLAVTGPRIARLPSATLYDSLTRADHRLFYAGIYVLAVAPAVVGAFWGAPLVAREVEAGTHRLVWNQSITRSRWLLAKISITTALAALGVGALSLAITWWSAPLDGAMGAERGNLPLRLTPISFGMRGLDPVALTVFAVSLGIACGVLLRRAVPAMALTMALVVVSQVVMANWVRPHLLPAASQTVVMTRQTLDGIGIDDAGHVHLAARSPHRGDWVLSQVTLDPAGRATSLPSWFVACLAPPRPGAPDGTRTKGPDVSGCFDRLAAEGYRQRVVYQPATRFWPLQWLESGVLLLVSGLLTLLTFRWTRRVS